MGYLIYRLTVRRGEEQRWPPALAYMAAANAPDMDVILGVLLDDPMRYHHDTVGNSLGCALIFALICRLCAISHQRAVRWKHGFLFFGLYVSHVLLDFLGQERALPLLWPLDTTRYLTPSGIFPGLSWTEVSSLGFLISLFTLENLMVLGFEILLMLPRLVLTEVWHKRGVGRA